MTTITAAETGTATAMNVPAPALSVQARAAYLKELMDQIKAEYDRVRGEADLRLRELHEQLGVTAMEVRAPGLGAIAKLSLSCKDTAIAVDQAALLAWAQQRHPTEVEEVTVHTVRPAFAKQLQGRLVADADGNVIDTETGERIDWARVVPAGPPTVTMTFATDARQRMRDAYLLGEVTIGDMLGLNRDWLDSVRGLPAD